MLPGVSKTLQNIYDEEFLQEFWQGPKQDSKILECYI